jgi:predicted RNase H-like HicB family nuclease
MARKKIEVKFKATDYLYKVGWSEDDDAYVARVVEFPSLGAHGDTLEKALAEIQKVVRIVLKDLAESGEEIPEPFGKRKFSGKLSVRMPEEIHRDLAILCAELNETIESVDFLCSLPEKQPTQTNIPFSFLISHFSFMRVW